MSGTERTASPSSTLPSQQRRRSSRGAGISELQGQYLAFIHLYTQLNGQAPGELDMQRHFRVSPPSVHGMILMLERKGLISRTPGAARSVRVLVPKEKLPELKQVER
jgi:SOS-response transcriptional repressor LexA